MRTAILLLVAALLIALEASPAAARDPGLTFIVTRSDDADPAGPGNFCVPAINAQLIDRRHLADCSLREAILTTNRTLEADTIHVPPGTYTLSIPTLGEEEGPPDDLNIATDFIVKGVGGVVTKGWTGDLDITSDLTIVGVGADKTIIDGASIDRVFDIYANVTIVGVTIRNGSADGRSGGGIHNAAKLTLIDVVIIGNSAADGAGVHNDSAATLVLINTTISGNTASALGGGIYNGDGSEVTLINTTVSGNTAGASGGGIWNSGRADLRNATISENAAAGSGGGIHGGGPVRVGNSIVAGNRAGQGGPDCSGGLASAGHNLVQQTSGCTITGATTGNIIGLDPKLGPLAANGSAIFTHAPLAGSPAIDAGNPATPGDGTSACELFDQRGVARPLGPGCDIGAFEAPQADLALGASHSPDPAVAGSSLIYSFAVTNEGPSDATAVTLTDTLPPGVTFISVAPSQGRCTEASGTVTCDLASLPSGASATLTIQATVPPSTMGTLSSVVSVTGPEHDPDAANNTFTQELSVEAQADLSVASTLAPTSAVAGRELTYDFLVTNDGPSHATGAALTITLPSATDFISASAMPGICVQLNGTVTCDLGSLASGSTAMATVRAAVPSSAREPFSSTVSVRGNETDPDTGNNAATVQTGVRTETDLSLAASVSPDQVETGGNLIYAITITNDGPSDATGLTLTDTLPAGASIVSARAAGGVCSESNGGLTCDLGSLASGGEVTATITLRPEEQGTAANSISVSGREADPDAANNSATLRTTVTAAGSFPIGAIIAIVVGAAVIAGGALMYLQRERQRSRT